MRAHYLDSLRGLAVVWMIIFHAAYDLHLFNFLSLNFSSGFWYGFPRVIAFTFLFCVGLSLNFGHRPRPNWRSLKIRTLKLGAAAFAVSVATYFLFPAQWVFFGTLHCILVGSLLGAVFVNHRKLAGICLIMILLGQYVFSYDIHWVSSIIKKPSMDFIPIYPWFWSILAGILAEPYLSKTSSLARMRPSLVLNFLGQHSLKIYLLHQPILFGLIWIIAQVNSA